MTRDELEQVKERLARALTIAEVAAEIEALVRFVELKTEEKGTNPAV